MEAYLPELITLLKFRSVYVIGITIEYVVDDRVDRHSMLLVDSRVRHPLVGYFEENSGEETAALTLVT